MPLRRNTNVGTRVTHRITSSTWFVAIPGRSGRDNKVAMGLVSERVQRGWSCARRMTVSGHRRFIWWRSSFHGPYAELVAVRKCSTVSYNYGRSFATIREMNDIITASVARDDIKILLLVDRRVFVLYRRMKIVGFESRDKRDHG